MMETYAAKPHMVQASRVGEDYWSIEVAPGEYLILTDEAFRERYEPATSGNGRTNA